MPKKQIKSEDVKILKRILTYLKPFKMVIAAIILLIIFSSLISIIQPLLGKIIMDNGFVAKNVGVVAKYSLITLILVIISQGIELLETVLYSGFNAKFHYFMFKTAFRKMLNFKLNYFDTKNYSEITNNLTTDVDNVTKITDKSSLLIVGQIFKIISGIVGLCVISWKLTILVLCVIPFKYLIVQFLTKKRKKAIKYFLSVYRDFYSWLGDTISGIKEVKLWNLKSREIGKFNKKQRKMIKVNRELSYLDNYNTSAEVILYQLLNYLLYIIGAMMITKNTLTVGGLFAFITYSVYVTSPLSLIINLIYNFANIIPSAKRLFEFFDEEMETRPILGKPEHRYIRLPENGAIRFENVSFEYNSEKKILNNLNFEIAPGEKIAFVGSNGAGKTTLLNLILRFYSPTGGHILFNGTDVSNIKLEDYRSMFSVVSQEPYLFNATIEENVNLRSADLSSVLEALRKSGADTFIGRLADGRNTIVGRNGAKLSGGERQKIAVARVFVNDSPIIVFDEATSNFDCFSDEYLNRVIFSELDEKTVIVITHKSGILKYMDKIFELKDGNISEKGSPAKPYPAETRQTQYI